MKILMVCLGNICRSPIAEGVLQNLANKNNLQWVIESAGTNQFHIGEAPHKSSQKICLENGIDISNQKARPFCKEDFEKYDMIFALATDVLDDIKSIAGNSYKPQKIKLLLDVLFPNQNKSITDPWYGNEQGYYPVFEEIKKCCEAIIEKYSK